MPHRADHIATFGLPQLFAAIEQATQTGVAAVDLDRVQTYVSPAFCRLLGFSADELLGRRAPFPYWPPEHTATIERAFARTIAGTIGDEELVLPFATGDGRLIEVDLKIAPILDGETVTGWVASVCDVTARRRAEMQLSESQRQARIGSWRWQAGDDAFEWSDELYRQYGRDRRHFTPTLDAVLAQIPDDDRPGLEAMARRALEHGETIDVELQVHRPDGATRTQRVLGTIERSADGRAVAAYGTCQDVTEQRRFEQERLDETLGRIAPTLGPEFDARGFAQQITDEATRLAGAEWGALLLTDPEGDAAAHPEVYTWSSLTAETDPRGRPGQLDLPLVVAAPSQVLRIDDARTDAGLARRFERCGGVAGATVSYLAVPIEARDGRQRGGLVLGHRAPGRFGRRQEQLVTTLAGHIGVALDNARLYRQLRANEATARASRLQAERTAALLADQRTVLEMLADGAPLHQTLDQLVRTIEKHAGEGIRGSVLLLDPDSRQLRHGAAPSLPDVYNEAIDGLVIGPGVGSCGTAAHLGQAVFVADIETDPLWTAFKDLALAHGLRACWSTPICATDMGVLGTFALYDDKAGLPSETVQQLLASLNRTAALAIEQASNRAALHAANQRKDEFLALLGHELRNPLAPILTALELMAQKDAGCERERAAIDRHVRHMMQLVDDLLDISRITRGKLDLACKPLRLDRILEQAVDLAAPLIEARRHHLELSCATDAPLVVHGDAIRLAQVFANLLTNAARYTDAGGRIEIVARPEAETAAVFVRDTGRGIPADLIEHVFEPFTQGGREIDRAEGGLGLGLPLVRSLVELHGGEVTLHSNGDGLGTEVRVLLPLATSLPSCDLPTIAVGPGERTSTPRPRVLVVDDNKDAADLMGELLRLAGHDVVVTHDGPSALTLCAEQVFDTAVVDIGLPVMDGYELGRRLLERHPLRLIAVTGYGQARDRQLSQRAGFAAHLVKPVQIDELIELIAAEDASDGA